MAAAAEGEAGRVLRGFRLQCRIVHALLLRE
jgi:hypothetical protein